MLTKSNQMESSCNPRWNVWSAVRAGSHLRMARLFFCARRTSSGSQVRWEMRGVTLCRCFAPHPKKNRNIKEASACPGARLTESRTVSMALPNAGPAAMRSFGQRAGGRSRMTAAPGPTKWRPERSATRSTSGTNECHSCRIARDTRCKRHYRVGYRGKAPKSHEGSRPALKHLP
jgi:hypothetical protein